MRFDTTQPPFDWGIARHARPMDVCRLAQHGESLRHRTLPAHPDTLLQAMAPSRDDLVVAVACMFPWYGLAALATREGMAVVLGQALAMQAMPGGQAKNDTMDSHKMAVLLRGGRLPQASVSPAERRATRDLVRRRRPLLRTRAERLAPVQQTHSQYNLPESGKKSAYQAKRTGGAARLPAPAVQQSLAVDLAVSDYDDRLLSDLAVSIVKTARQPDAHPLSRLQTVPGLGKLVSRGLR